jgi:hypothetical protein
MSTTVSWSNEQVMDAYNEAVNFLSGERPGVLGYKVGQIRLTLNQMAKGISDSATNLVDRFRREVDGHKLPHSQDGHPLPMNVWCSDPATYREEDAALMAVKQDITFTVRLSYDELRHLNLRGNFWVALNDLIDPPKADPPTMVPSAV